MIENGAHATYIVWSYAGAAIAVIALIAYVAWDARRARLRLAALDDAGIRRRSAGTSN